MIKGIDRPIKLNKTLIQAKDWGTWGYIILTKDSIQFWLCLHFDGIEILLYIVLETLFRDIYIIHLIITIYEVIDIECL